MSEPKSSNLMPDQEKKQAKWCNAHRRPYWVERGDALAQCPQCVPAGLAEKEADYAPELIGPLMIPPVPAEESPVWGSPAGTIRAFDTGATRSSEQGRYDPEGFLSPIVLERFCEYMHKHRTQSDGTLRASDNWQRGMPRETYIKGMWRHFLHLWTRHRGFEVRDYMAAGNIEEDLCALMFNVQGYLFEILKSKEVKSND